MFNKIFRRGKTNKEDVSSLPPTHYKNSLKTPSEYEYGPKTYNYNNKSAPYSTGPGVGEINSPTGANKYPTTNNLAPPWSNYDASKYDPSPVGRSQNVYTAPPQRNLPYAPPNNSNIHSDRDYESRFKPPTSPNNLYQPSQYTPAYKNTNIANAGYPNRADKPESNSPYINLGSTYSQSRPSYDASKRDGSINRSLPGTPTTSRKEYDPNSYNNRNPYQSAPVRNFESPQRDQPYNRSTFSPSTNLNANNRFGTRATESPYRENDSTRNNYMQSQAAPQTPVRNFTSPLNNQYTPTATTADPFKYDNSSNPYAPHHNSVPGNNANYSGQKPSLNNANTSNTNRTPGAAEPGKYVPFAIRKALKEQQAQQSSNEEGKANCYNSTLNNTSNKPPSKYSYVPYKAVYETPDVSTRTKSAYSHADPSPYVKLSNIKPETDKYESPYPRLISSPPPELPPKNLSLARKAPEVTRNYAVPIGSHNNPTETSYGYFNSDQNENRSPYPGLYTPSQTYSPSIKSPTPYQNDHSMSNPNSFANTQYNTDPMMKNVYGTSNHLNTTNDYPKGNHSNAYNQESDATRNYNAAGTPTPFNVHRNTAPSSYHSTFSTPPTSNTSQSSAANENKFAAPQKSPYDTHQSYVQTPQYADYRSGERTAATTLNTNTNAFDDWLPKNASHPSENLPIDSTRNDSELWRRDLNNSNAGQFSATSFGTVPISVNASNYTNRENNLTNRNLSNFDCSPAKSDGNFERYSEPSELPELPPKSLHLNIPKPFTASKPSSNFSIASPLLAAASISTATASVAYEDQNDLTDEEADEDDVEEGNNDSECHQSSPEQISGILSDESRKSKSPKKTVRFLNPNDKSDDDCIEDADDDDAMAKGRNRGHNKHRNNNNNGNKKSNNGKKDTIKTALITPIATNTEISETKNNSETKSESEIEKNFKNTKKSNSRNNANDNSEINPKTNKTNDDEDDDDKIGYQITKSKNSRNIANKLQTARAKLASPEDDDSERNNFNVNNRGNTCLSETKQYDDNTTDNTDTETLDEAFEDDDDDASLRISNTTAKNVVFEQNKPESTRKAESASENKFTNDKSFSEKLFAQNVHQHQQHQPTQQVYRQQSVGQNSQLPSVNESNLKREQRSSERVGNNATGTTFTNQNKSDRDFSAGFGAHKGSSSQSRNAEQIEKIEKLSELTECDRDNFIRTQTSMGQSQAKPSTAPESPRLGRSRSSSPPNRTVNKPAPLNSSDYAEIYKCSSQREREPVVEEPLSPTTPLSPTESCDQFYDITNEAAAATTSSSNSKNLSASLPKVTVADYSEETSHNSNIEPDIFYDFETINTNLSGCNLSKSPPKYPPPPPAPSSQFKSRSASPIDIVTLEDIEEEEDEDEWHFVDDNKTSSSPSDTNSATRPQLKLNTTATPPTQQQYLSSPTLSRRNNNASNSTHQAPSSSPILSRKSPTPRKGSFDYDDCTDGLNTPDSGIGGATTPISTTSNFVRTSEASSNSKVLVFNSCDLVNDADEIELIQQKQTSQGYSSSNSSHNNSVQFCDSNNSYSEDSYEYSSSGNATTSIVIDSISLPDVVMEAKSSKESAESENDSFLKPQNGDFMLNVSKSKSEGNVHFIPIHVEGREKPKIEIVEETTEYSNPQDSATGVSDDNETNLSNGFIKDLSDERSHTLNGRDTSNITVIRNEQDTVKEDSGNNTSSTISSDSDNNNNNNIDFEEEFSRIERELKAKVKKAQEEKQKKEEELKRELVNQETRFNAQLEEAQRNASNAQERAHELQMKIDQLEQDISLKSWHIERLNGEIQAIQHEHNAVRKRLQTIEEEKDRIRLQSLDTEDELNTKYENLEDKYKELEEKYEKLRQLATSLQTQLAYAKSQADELQIEKEQLSSDKDSELKKLQHLLDAAIAERKELEVKWQKEFELLRNHNQEHEEQLLTDCECQLRSMQKKCKEKIEAAEKAKREALEINAELEEKVAEGEGYSERLKNLQAELRQLRGLSNEQRESITLMHSQIEELRKDLEAANIDLESKIEEVRKIKLYCDNTLLFKDREMVRKIDEATREVATIWEEKLLTEMTRLTNELEAVHSEDRLSDMNKLQTEHIEELKVLTNRYTSNEEELRKELEEVKEKLKHKTEQYMDLRDRADSEILKTRIHLDKADREYQQAMNKEFDKKQELEEKLRKEFDEEKAQMEIQFEERIKEIKENFKKEVTNQTQEIAQRHRLQLEQQWDQLVSEKEDAIQTLEKRHKNKMEDHENKLKNLEMQHRRDIKDLKEAYDLDRSSLQNRDINNSQEIEQLHRKCRCLTNLFEEMRLRYERREPRPEDLREIDELRARCDSQERDLCELTERLREMQMQMEEIQATSNDIASQRSNARKKPLKKPPPKQIPIACDVIYEEENEETESIGDDSTKQSLSENGFENGEESNNIVKESNDDTDEEADDDEEEEDDDE